MCEISLLMPNMVNRFVRSHRSGSNLILFVHSAHLPGGLSGTFIAKQTFDENEARGEWNNLGGTTRVLTEYQQMFSTLLCETFDSVSLFGWLAVRKHIMYTTNVNYQHLSHQCEQL